MSHDQGTGVGSQHDFALLKQRVGGDGMGDCWSSGRRVSFSLAMMCVGGGNQFLLLG